MIAEVHARSLLFEMGNARVSRAVVGVSPTNRACAKLTRHRNDRSAQSARRDAKDGTRDACATHFRTRL